MKNISDIDRKSRIFELLEDWIYFYQSKDFGNVSIYLIKEIIRLVYQHIDYILVSRSLLDPLPEYEPKIIITIRDFTYSDIDFVRIADRPSEARLCAKRLFLNHVGLSAFHNGHFVGHIWGTSKIETSITRINLKLKPGEFLYADVFTAPAFRRLGVQTALSLALFRKFHQLGFQNSIAYISRDNLPSLAVFKKLGSKEIGHIKYTRLGPWRRSYIYR